MGSVFEPFSNFRFNFAILQSDGNIEYFIDKLQIWEMGLAKTVAPSFKNLSDRLDPDPQLYFHPNPEGVLIVSSDTTLNLNLDLGYLRIFS